MLFASALATTMVRCTVFNWHGIFWRPSAIEPLKVCELCAARGNGPCRGSSAACVCDNFVSINQLQARIRECPSVYITAKP
jgi:hypothetical protein